MRLNCGAYGYVSMLFLKDVNLPHILYHPPPCNCLEYPQMSQMALCTCVLATESYLLYLRCISQPIMFACLKVLLSVSKDNLLETHLCEVTGFCATPMPP